MVRRCWAQTVTRVDVLASSFFTRLHVLFDHFLYVDFAPPTVGGLDLGSDNSGCARLGGSKVTPPLGVVEEKAVVVVGLVRRHRRAVGTAVRRAVDDEVPGAVEE